MFLLSLRVDSCMSLEDPSCLEEDIEDLGDRSTAQSVR